MLVSAVMKIKTLYHDLNPAQKNIAAFFLETDVNGLGSSIDEIAGRVGTSVASISRFCKKLGYESFGQFKIALSQDKTYEPDLLLPIFKPTDDADVCIHKAFSEAVTNLKDTEAKVDFGVIKKVVELLAESETVYFFGFGGSGGTGKLGELMLSHLGYKTKAVTDPYQMSVCSGHLEQGDLVFGISHTGRNKFVVDAVKIAGGKGAVTVAITNYGHSSLAKAAEFCLETSCYEGRVHFAQSNSMVAQITILNAIYLLAASIGGEEVIRQVDNIEEYCQRSLRLKT